MEYRSLGRSGLRVSAVGLGCNNFGSRIDMEATRPVVHQALDLGVTLFDTADVYGSGASETMLGEALGERRRHAVIATKFGGRMEDGEMMHGASRRYIMMAVEASLRRLRTDWIDLYQIHFPDGGTPLEETLRALDDLVRQGKVRYVGSSNFPAWLVAEAHWLARDLGAHGFVSCQNQYSLLRREPERELVAAMQHYGLGLLPYFPLASGLLTGKHRRGQLHEGSRLANNRGAAERLLTEENWRRLEALQAFAVARGHSLLELAVSWLAGRPTVASVIAGATRPEQVEQNVAAAGWQLTDEDVEEVNRIAPPG